MRKRFVVGLAVACVIVAGGVVVVGWDWLCASYYLHKMESSKDEEVLDAARKLAELKAARALPFMLEQLGRRDRTGDEFFWIECVQMYGEAGVNALISRYRTAGSEERKEILIWLSDVDREGAYVGEFLEEIARSDGAESLSAINALARIRATKEVAEELLVDLLVNGSEEERCFAARRFGRFETLSPIAVQALKGATEDEVKDVRYWSAHFLGIKGFSGDRVLRTLFECLSEDDRDWPQIAWVALRELGAGVAPWIVRHLQSGEPNGRRECVNLLMGFCVDSPEIVAVLRNIVEGDVDDARVKALAESALGCIGRE